MLSPTRELSAQILDSFRAYGRHLRIRSALAIGGVSMGGQVRSLLDGVDVLVATPGRLLDLVKGNALRLGEVECFVLDEADRMLDMGFIHDIRKIVAKLPAKRQTLMFSATMPRAIAELAAQMLHDPIKVAVTPEAATVERVEQRIIHVDRGTKPAILIDVLKRETIDRALIFTRTKHGADKVVRGLVHAGMTAEAIHGNKSQGQRERVLAAFRQGKVKTLVATDIAARGIDVDGISHVINFDLPNVPETYVHRIGRTARAGAAGVAISLCDGGGGGLPARYRKAHPFRIPASDRRLRPHRTGSRRRPTARAAAAADGQDRHWHARNEARDTPRHDQPARSVGTISRDINSREGSAARHDQPSHDRSQATISPMRPASRPSASCVAMAGRIATALHAQRGGSIMRKEHNMPKEELLQFEGLVTEILPDARYRVQLDNGHQLVAYTAGRMKKNRIKTLAGDRVTVEVSPYDLEKGA